MPDRPAERSVVNLVREKGGFVLRDNAAGYYRPLDRREWARLGAQWLTLEADRITCEGVIPSAD